VIGFSAGAYIAAEMAAASPGTFNRMVLVGPLGLRPTEGEIFDFLAVTIRTHVAATVSNIDTPEFGRIYGGDMTPAQFELFEDARAETARLGWEPFMFNPSLGHHLQGIGDLPTLLVWGTDDLIAPRGCVSAYEGAIPAARVVEIAGAGHRPEIEDPEAFLSAVTTFLGG
jgi:pimeloyl-ACP methyl ester carboxylesterase